MYVKAITQSNFCLDEEVTVYYYIFNHYFYSLCVCKTVIKYMVKAVHTNNIFSKICNDLINSGITQVKAEYKRTATANEINN